MTPIGYKMRDREMMAMVTTVVHQVEEPLEAMVMGVWPVEDEVSWCAITVTSMEI